jgi:hypothetical protein
VFKLDIDDEVTEERFVRQLLQDPSLAARIDEL